GGAAHLPERIDVERLVFEEDGVGDKPIQTQRPPMRDDRPNIASLRLRLTVSLHVIRCDKAFVGLIYQEIGPAQERLNPVPSQTSNRCCRWIEWRFDARLGIAGQREGAIIIVEREGRAAVGAEEIRRCHDSLRQRYLLLPEAETERRGKVCPL